jgi:hypothetical protein
MVVGSEFGKAVPVAAGELGGIADALPALLRRIDEEHAAEAFAGQPPERAFLVAIEQQHRFVPVEQIDSGSDAGDSPSDDQHIAAVFLHRPEPPCPGPVSWIDGRGFGAGQINVGKMPLQGSASRTGWRRTIGPAPRSGASCRARPACGTA